MMTTGALQITTPSDREIQMTREFDAPRELVFKAYTTPDLLKRWLGVFGGWSLAVCEVDLRVGGPYRWVWQRGETKMGVSGVYREIAAPVRVVATERFDNPWYEGDGLVTVTFDERGGRTTLTMTIRYISKEVRDAVLKSGMETGVGASFDKLAELLPSISV
jgi:uncharacterized protein YndB with AHSA1/START domain